MKHLFVSAHLDDAVISCGDYIDELVRSGHAVTVATVFTGTAGRLSMLARIVHKKFGLRDRDVMDVRRLEDRDACGSLGAGTIHLDLPECLYRFDAAGRPKYGKLHELFEADPSAEPDVRAAVYDALAALPLDGYDRICVPLGIGRHIDHLLVRQAAAAAAARTAQTRKLVYYRDLPYLDYGTDPLWRSELAGDMREERIPLPPSALRRKLAAIELYRSQLTMLWPSRYRMLRHIAAHARPIDGARPPRSDRPYALPLYVRPH